MKNLFNLSLGFLLGVLFLGTTIPIFASSVLFPYQGGTGTSTVPSTNNVLVGQSNGTYAPQYSLSQSTSPTTIVQRDGNSNVFANNFIFNSNVTVSSGTTTILTSASARIQMLTGTQNQTYQLPNATTMNTGSTFEFNNNSTGNLTINNGSGTTLATLIPGAYARISATSTSSVGGGWDKHYLIASNDMWGSNYVGIGTSTPASTLSVQGFDGINPLTISSSSGATMFTVLPNGNVGIGTASPGAPLQVSGGAISVPAIFSTTGNNSYLQVNNTNGNGLWFGQESSQAFVSEIQNLPLQLRTNNTTQVTILANGNVGIGTTTPSALLSIQGTGSNYFNVDNGGNVGLTGNITKTSAATLTLSTASGQNIQLNPGSGGAVYVNSPNFFMQDGTQGLNRPAVNQLAILSGGAERMRFDASGNVGIGTTSPSYNLDVSGGNATNIARISNTNSNYNVLDMTAYGTGGAVQNMIRFNSGAIQEWAIGDNQANSDALTFAAGATLTSSPTLTLLRSGNVGIGTTTPNYNLNVAGGGGTNGIDIQTTGGTNPGIGRIFTSNDENKGGNAIFLGRYDSAPYLTVGTGGSIMGNVGIGTSIPSATLHVKANAGTNALIVASSSGTAVFTVDTKGHTIYGGTAPTMGTCGTSPSVLGGNDNVMRVLAGTGVITSCTVNFATSWSNPPVCTANLEGGLTVTTSASSTVSSVTVTGASAITGDTITILCRGY